MSNPRFTWAALALVLLLPGAAVFGATEDDEEQRAGDGAESSRPVDENGHSDSTGGQAGEPLRLEDQLEYVRVDTTGLPTSNSIATKLPMPLRLTPANVGTVSAPLFDEQDAVVMSDALRNVSGLNVQPNFGVHDFFLIRGFDSLNGGLILTDGAAEPAATWYPLYNVVGVEVWKGPAGFLYGSDPLGGAINIVRKQPLPSNFVGVDVSGGSFGTFEGKMDWNASNAAGDQRFRLNGMWLESEQYRDDKQSRHVAVNPSYTWKPNEKSTLNFNLEVVDAEYSPDSGLPLVGNEIPPVARTTSYQSPFDFSDQRLDRFQVDYESELSERLTLRNKTYYRGLDWLTKGTQFVGVTPDQTGELQVIRTQLALDDRQQSYGNQFEAILSLNSGSVRHSLLAGLEVNHRTDDFDIGVVPPVNPLTPELPGIPSISLFDPVETATDVAPLPYLAGTSESTVVAPYVSDQIRFSQKFQMLLGARYDWISRDDERFLAFTASQDKISRDDGKLSPLIGAVYAPTPSLSAYANAGRSYAPASPRIIGDLEPEQGTQFELGVKKKFLGDRMQTTFALFEIERENIAIPDDNGVTQQAGDQRSRGFEIELAAEPLSGLRTFFSYAYTDAVLTQFTERVAVGIDPSGQIIEATVDRSGNTPAFVPEHLGSLWVSKSLGRWGVGGGLRLFSDQFIAEDNEFTLDGAVVFDATVYYNFKSWRAQVNFKNLTDTAYEGRGVGSTSVIPADPFAVYVGIGYQH
jgi:catecholate siderophore receptor